MAGKCQTPKNLMETFGLNKKSSLKGLKIVNVNAPKDSPLHTTALTAIHHIHDVNFLSLCVVKRTLHNEINVTLIKNSLQ